MSDQRIKLIVEVNDDVAAFYTSIKAAETDLEAIDVDNGEYPRAWGPEGEPYRLTSAENQVIVVEDESRAPSLDELGSLVRRYLARVGVETSDRDDLPALLRKCEPYIDY